jgi:hypothetical protein
MLPKIATLSYSNFSLENRSSKRRSIEVGFEARERADKSRVLILDLSRTGMRIQTSARFEIGESVGLHIPEAGPVSATIVREIRNDFEGEFGAEFDEPITEAAVSAVLLAAPPFASPIAEEEKDQWLREAKAKYPEFNPVSDLWFFTIFSLIILVTGCFIYAIGFLSI